MLLVLNIRALILVWLIWNVSLCFSLYFEALYCMRTVLEYSQHIPCDPAKHDEIVTKKTIDFLTMEAHLDAQQNCTTNPNTTYIETFSTCSGRFWDWDEWINFQVFLPYFNSIALRKAKIVYNFGLSECNRVKGRQLQGFSIGFCKTIATIKMGSNHKKRICCSCR